MKPPIGGPRTLARPHTKLAIDIILPRFSGAAMSASRMYTKANAAPAPTPWSPRATISSTIEVEKPATSEPAKKMAMAKPKRCLLL